LLKMVICIYLFITPACTLCSEVLLLMVFLSLFGALIWCWALTTIGGLERWNCWVYYC
jgi:hypothetical protein